MVFFGEGLGGVWGRYGGSGHGRALNVLAHSHTTASLLHMLLHVMLWEPQGASMLELANKSRARVSGAQLRCQLPVVSWLQIGDIRKNQDVLNLETAPRGCARRKLDSRSAALH